MIYLCVAFLLLMAYAIYRRVTAKDFGDSVVGWVLMVVAECCALVSGLGIVMHEVDVVRMKVAIEVRDKVIHELKQKLDQFERGKCI